MNTAGTRMESSRHGTFRQPGGIHAIGPLDVRPHCVFAGSRSCYVYLPSGEKHDAGNAARTVVPFPTVEDI